MSLRIIFMGTPEFSVPTLRTLADAGHEIVAVYTQPPRPGGRRGLDLQKSPVHQAAELLGCRSSHPSISRSRPSGSAFARSMPTSRSSSPTACCCRRRF